MAFEGIEARAVDVQVQVAPGLPAFHVVGLPDKAVSKARERVRAALTASGRCPTTLSRSVTERKIESRPQLAVESKGSTRPWAIQSHYVHPGWYLVWRYLVDLTMTIRPSRPVVVWRVDVVFLTKTDWKYEGSSAGSTGGGRTHTFGVKAPAEPA